LTGRVRALVGLLLSILLASAAIADGLTYRTLIRREARQFAADWFVLIQKNLPRRAHQFTLASFDRQPADVDLDAYYADGRPAELLKTYIEKSPVEKLLALNGQFEARYYSTPEQRHNAKQDELFIVFEVSYEEVGIRQSLLVGFPMQRHRLDTGGVDWQMIGLPVEVTAEEL